MRKVLISILHGPSKEEIDNQIRRSYPFAQGFELRLDLFSELALSCLAEIRQSIAIPVIFSLRKKSHGGNCSLDEPRRLQLLASLLCLQPDYCDLETDVDPVWVQKFSPQFPQVAFLRSYHNFKETPSDLETLYQSMKRPEFNLYKIAVHAQNTIDMLRLMDFASDKKDLIWISMGPQGQPSRILGPVTGSIFSYCGLELRQNALHQIDLQTLVQLYRFAEINPQTQIYALIGDPIDASIGHLYHNQAFAKMNKNSVYVKLRLVPEELSPFFQWIRKLPFFGLSVTMPYKTAVLPFLDKIEQTAQSIQAVNTIHCKNSLLTGYNTDGKGALNALERHIPVQGKKMKVLGAGGAARAVIYEAVQRGAIVEVYNRTFQKAQQIADLFDCEAHPWDQLAQKAGDILINTIPSLPNGPFPLPLDSIFFPPYVMDIAVQAKDTAFSSKAKEAKSTLISWQEMFYEQAALQQDIWNS